MDAIQTVIHAFITSRLDYCISTLYGIPKKETSKLQGIQNTAAHLITDIFKYDHITLILRELHWLHIDKWIIYKLLLITHKCLNSIAPAYLSILLSLKPSCGICSDHQMPLTVPRSNLVSYGDRAFSNAVPIYGTL